MVVRLFNKSRMISCLVIGAGAAIWMYYIILIIVTAG